LSDIKISKTGILHKFIQAANQLNQQTKRLEEAQAIACYCSYPVGTFSFVSGIKVKHALLPSIQFAVLA